jgi:hypothetical protein
MIHLLSAVKDLSCRAQCNPKSFIQTNSAAVSLDNPTASRTICMNETTGEAGARHHGEHPQTEEPLPCSAAG